MTLPLLLTPTWVVGGLSLSPELILRLPLSSSTSFNFPCSLLYPFYSFLWFCLFISSSSPSSLIVTGITIFCSEPVSLECWRISVGSFFLSSVGWIEGWQELGENKRRHDYERREGCRHSDVPAPRQTAFIFLFFLIFPFHLILLLLLFRSDPVPSSSAPFLTCLFLHIYLTEVMQLQHSRLLSFYFEGDIWEGVCTPFLWLYWRSVGRVGYGSPRILTLIWFADLDRKAVRSHDLLSFPCFDWLFALKLHLMTIWLCKSYEFTSNPSRVLSISKLSPASTQDAWQIMIGIGYTNLYTFPFQVDLFLVIFLLMQIPVRVTKCLPSNKMFLLGENRVLIFFQTVETLTDWRLTTALRTLVNSTSFQKDSTDSNRLLSIPSGLPSLISLLS